MSVVYLTLFGIPAVAHIESRKETKKTVIITGANRGIGLSAARRLAATNKWNVVLACRSIELANAAKQSIMEGSENVSVAQLDLADLKSVRNFSHQWGRKTIDCLALNAGLHTGSRTIPLRSAQGYELTVATNHIGHFYLTKLLLGNLQRSENGRIIVVASSVHNANSVKKGLYDPTMGDFQGMKAGFREPFSMINGSNFNADKAYKDSKLCNVLFTKEFSRRLQADKSTITCNSMSPGLIPTTGLFREYNTYLVGIFDFIMRNLLGIAVSEDEGGRRLAYMIESTELDGVTGAYYAKKKGTDMFIDTPVSQEAQDPEVALQLWNLTENLLKDID